MLDRGAAAEPGAQGLDAFLDDAVVRNVARQYRQVRVLIDRLALAEQAGDGRFGGGGLAQGGGGAAPGAGHYEGGGRPQPDPDRIWAGWGRGAPPPETTAPRRPHD